MLPPPHTHTYTHTHTCQGVVYELNVSLWNTSYVFQAGHSVRITVSSSNSPRFKPNPNTGKPLSEEDGTLIKTTNTLHHSLVLPSRLTLPVVE